MTPSDYRTLFDLTGKTAIVTGAGRGIGLAISDALMAWGANIVVAELDATTCATAVARLTQGGGRAVGVAADITVLSELRSVFDRAEEEFGGFDILVNNAGISARIPAESYPDAAFDSMIDLNVTALFRGMREAASRWIKAGRGGNIINMASFAGVVADPMSAPYAASKGAVVQLTRTCAVEWASHDIRVNAIGPGYVRTEMTSATLDTPAAAEVIRQKTALGRAARPDEIASAAVYLASSASSYVTGHILMVDGGWTAL
jgi:NAD(P)-dependent dehydrogenase (short-subunit alcohol dehydrogenase family)